MKNKKILIGGGVAAIIVGAIVGRYIYIKNSIKKIAAAMDDDFDIEDDNAQYEYKAQQEKINGQKVTIENVYPKEDNSNGLWTIIFS